MSESQTNAPIGFCQCGCGRKTNPAPCDDPQHGWVKGEPLRFIRNHHRRKSPVAFKVDLETGCWNWQRSKDGTGYGQRWVGDRYARAHRFFYEQLVGPIPVGLEIDHLCRNRACVNPDHLEPVTHRENDLRGVGPPAVNAAKTQCIHGHLFDKENTYVWSDGSRQCRTCRQQRSSARRRGT